KTYTMKKSAPSTTLAGTRGQVVLNADGEALTFLPASSGATGSASAAVIVYRSGSTAGFDALAGNNRYTIYKNGAAATAADLRENDVATYSAATNAIRVCDTRVTAYYEDCSPSPSAAVTVTILGGTKFSVLPSAQSALSDFRPGDAVTFLLSADGQIAGALKPGANAASRGNAAGVVDASGKTWLVCGGTAIPLAVTASDTKYYGKVVEFYSASKDRVGMSEIGYTGLGDLNVAERKLGGTPLAENALVFDGGALVALSSLDRTVPASDVAYARTNWAGKVDLIVLRGAEELTFYGRAVVNENSDGRRTIGVEYGAGKSFGPFGSKYSIRNGDFVKATLNREQSGYTDMTILDKVESVTSAEWIGNAAVTHGGKTYTVAASTPCYSADSGKWMSVEAARDYAVSYNLYVTDNVVRVIELVK
ncbi:MAG: hypothetical protein IKN53_02920, partial [Oscillibacter sp.]|nr:hypothetical protein [Oscillibacter sp.]